MLKRLDRALGAAKLVRDLLDRHIAHKTHLDDLALIVLSNIAGFDAGGLARDICDAALGMSAPVRARIPFDAATADRFTGTYSDAITTFTVERDAD